MGYFATGMAFADLNGDRLPDMIVSSGNDMAPQSLTAYYNTPALYARFNLWPDWYSGDIDYQFDLATGDVDGDGRIDVAVAVGFDHTRAALTGSVKVYLNREAGLEAQPSYRSEGGFLAMGCAFGDVNGDGALDLAVAAMGNMTFPPTTPRSAWKPGHARIYLNRADRTLSPTPAWTAAVPNYGGDVLLADVNLDGFMDLVVAGDQLQIFQGHAPQPGEMVPIDRWPAWESPKEALLAMSYSVDQGSLSPGAPVSLAVTRLDPLRSRTHEVLVFEPPKKEAVWRYRDIPYPSKLLLADLDGDQQLDLAVGQWGEQAQGGPLLLFQGTGTTPPFPTAPAFTSSTRTVLEGIDAADTRQLCLREKQFQITAKGAGPVVTLPERRINTLRSVTRNGVPLTPAQYAWVPNGNWVSTPLQEGDQLQIIYDVSAVMDLGVANYQNYSPQIGNYMFLSTLQPQDCREPPAAAPPGKAHAPLPHR